MGRLKSTKPLVGGCKRRYIPKRNWEPAYRVYLGRSDAHDLQVQGLTSLYVEMESEVVINTSRPPLGPPTPGTNTPK